MDTVDLKRRVKLYQDHQRDGYGAIIVQANIEDTRLGVQEYAIEKLGVECVELKWGQGAKDIGGEVKISDLKKAQMLYERGYIVLPDPTDPDVIKAFEQGAFKEFERHSRVGMVTEESFAQRVEELRKAGAKYVFLKTGAYRPADLARAVGFCLPVPDRPADGRRRRRRHRHEPLAHDERMGRSAGRACTRSCISMPSGSPNAGSTCRRSPWPADSPSRIRSSRDCALGAPFVKLVGMARAPIAAAMVGKTIGRTIDEEQVPVYIERFGNTKDEIFVTASRAAARNSATTSSRSFRPGALGLYTYYERLAQGLRQLMAGSRKFALQHISRDDIAALTPRGRRGQRHPIHHGRGQGGGRGDPGRRDAGGSGQVGSTGRQGGPAGGPP